MVLIKKNIKTQLFLVISLDFFAIPIRVGVFPKAMLQVAKFEKIVLWMQGVILTSTM